ncbi:O-antigen ligase family protein [Oscillochloris sp. ZM17-4]|uniref:O-antigen ligase family protein n=1 Tax=Oscillochloris sp. ZM17-4 TaxID=2866714 RepID=UPI001C737805|nr:O-antigen ligase family protein [Oscillochloris sp. ZM17-4]MBX0330765.1 O-antigen ligase family protein [Oscillochloris sp. ZM17-4]
MRTVPQETSPNLLPHERLLIGGAILACVGAVVAVQLLPERYILLSAVLLLGAPLASLVFLRQFRANALLLMLILVPLTGIFKAISGSRFAPLTFDLGILAALAIYMAGQITRGRQRVGWVDLLHVLFLGLAFFQMFNPNVPSLQAGVEGFRKFAYMSIALYAGRYTFTDTMARRFEWLLIILSVPIAAYGIKQFLMPSSLDYRLIDLSTASEVTYLMGGRLRPFATLPGPFHLGLYLVVAGLITFRMMLTTRLWSIRFWALGMALGVQMITLFLTRTKGNWVGMAVGVGVIILFQIALSPNLRQKLRRLMVGTAIASVAVVALLAVALSGRIPVLTDALGAVLDPLNAPTFIYRLQIWRDELLPALVQHPLIGYGTSSAGEGLSVYYEGATSFFVASHNLFLKVQIELGAFGLLIFLAIIGLCLRRGLSSLRYYARTSPGRLQTTQWAIAVACAFLVSGLVTPVLDAYPANYYFWLLLGLMTRPWGQATQLAAAPASLPPSMIIPGPTP